LLDCYQTIQICSFCCLALESVIKDIRSQGSCPVWTLCRQGGSSDAEYGPLHCLVQKTPEWFWNVWRVRMEKGRSILRDFVRTSFMDCPLFWQHSPRWHNIVIDSCWLEKKIVQAA